MKTPPGWYLGLILVLLCSSGASCRPWTRPSVPASPVVFNAPPTLDEVLYNVNTSSARVQRLSTDTATLSTPGMPSLRATMAVERPLRFRLRGRLIAQELDLGSNQELFWFWARSDPENALYYAYHQQFVQTTRNTVLPVGPDWLIEALGLVQLDPNGQHDGPQVRPDGSLTIRSRVDRQGSTFYRVLTLDPKYAWITEQRLLDAAGAELAVARCSNHAYYADAGVSLPHRVQISLPPAQLSFQVEVAKYAVNAESIDAGGLFEIPSLPEVRLVNLAESLPGAGIPTAAPSANLPSPAASTPSYPANASPRSAYQMRYRGYPTTNR